MCSAVRSASVSSARMSRACSRSGPAGTVSSTALRRAQERDGVAGRRRIEDDDVEARPARASALARGTRTCRASRARERRDEAQEAAHQAVLEHRAVDGLEAQGEQRRTRGWRPRGSCRRRSSRSEHLAHVRADGRTPSSAGDAVVRPHLADEHALARLRASASASAVATAVLPTPPLPVTMRSRDSHAAAYSIDPRQTRG